VRQTPPLGHLFTPLRLGPVELPNRIVSTAHQTGLVRDHLPTPEFIAYHEARARGGTGLIVIEATAIHATGLLTPHTLGGYLPEIVDGYRRVVAAVKPHGTRLFVQLFPRRPRADRNGAAAHCRRAVGGAEPALPGRAQGAP
jgi:2,4-dienoyl-CoA reductase-like NADH-dependent reductase (Old Yellow Enzyme family)